MRKFDLIGQLSALTSRVSNFTVGIFLQRGTALLPWSKIESLKKVFILMNFDCHSRINRRAGEKETLIDIK